MIEPTYEELQAKIALLEKKATPKDLYFKVSEKGGLSIYGLGRFPVTLYCGQWFRLLGYVDTIRQALVDNWDQLMHKDGEVKPN